MKILNAIEKCLENFVKKTIKIISYTLSMVCKYKAISIIILFILLYCNRYSILKFITFIIPILNNDVASSWISNGLTTITVITTVYLSRVPKKANISYNCFSTHESYKDVASEMPVFYVDLFSSVYNTGAFIKCTGVIIQGKTYDAHFENDLSHTFRVSSNDISRIYIRKEVSQSFVDSGKLIRLFNEKSTNDENSEIKLKFEDVSKNHKIKPLLIPLDIDDLKKP